MMPTTEVPALKISGLTKTYNNGFTALKGIDLTVPQGGFLLCLGQMVLANPRRLALSAPYFHRRQGRLRFLGWICSKILPKPKSS